MKLTIYKSLLIFTTVATLMSCSKDDRLLFNEPTSIYVEATPDSVDYTFATSPATVLTDTINIPFRIIGTSSESDRKISFVPRADATAKEGYHYKIGEAVIRANEFSTTVPVYVFRKAGLKDSVVTVILDLKESADFKLGYADRLNYKISITDILLKPTLWDGVWSGYFGSYSEVKFRFLLEATGRTNWNAYPFPQDTRYLSQKAKNALLAYNQANGDLIDENGEVVIFP
jgi:hypothetical protein